MDYISWVSRRRRKRKGRKGYTTEYSARLQYVDPDTGERKEFWRSAENQQEARRALSKLEEEYEERGPRAIEGERMTFAELVKHCKEKRYVDAQYDKELRKVGGVRGKKTVWGHMKVLEEFFGKMQLREINVASIREYKRWRVGRKTRMGTTISLSTINRELSTMRAMFNEAIVNDLGRIRISPFERAKKGELIDPSAEVKRQTTISFEEEDVVLEKCAGDYLRHATVLLICALDTGARRGELLGVRKSTDLHFGQGKFLVNGRPCEDCRQNIGDHMIVCSWKRNGGIKRAVPVTPRVKAAILDLIENPGIATFKTGRKSKKKPDPDLVFGVGTYQRACEKVRAAAGLDHVRLHDLRHTAATRMKELGLALEDIGVVLGHSDPRTSDPRTTQRYVNNAPQVVRRASEVLHQIRVAHEASLDGQVGEESVAIN
jgi:integrase